MIMVNKPSLHARRRARQRSPLPFEELANSKPGNAGYHPLPSVWYGDDAELLEQMLQFYPRKPPEDILDATVNTGRFWAGTRRKIVGMDIDRRHKPDIVADNRKMPCE